MKKLMLGLIFVAALVAPAWGAETFKIAFIDPLSGPFANVGENYQKNVQFAVDGINAEGGVLNGVKLELLSYDSKLSAQEAQIAFTKAVNDGARVVFTGSSGSTVVAALVAAAAKYNERNPGKELLVINFASIDPDLTGKNCNYWFFSTEANTAMKMRALTNFMKGRKDIKKVYLLNQDYAHGRAWAKLGREMLAEVRPDIKIVGETYHPIGKVKDFSPYIARIKASGADTVITGNWGNDLVLLVRAASDAGMDLRYINHTAGGSEGTVVGFSLAKKGRITWVAEWNQNVTNAKAGKREAEFKKRFPKVEWQLAPRVEMAPHLLAAAINRAKSSNTFKIALALENLTYQSVVGEVKLRREDHQLLIPQTVATVAPVDGKLVKFGLFGTNVGHRTEGVYSGASLTIPNACQMQRPSGL